MIKGISGKLQGVSRQQTYGQDGLDSEKNLNMLSRRKNSYNH